MVEVVNGSPDKEMMMDNVETSPGLVQRWRWRNPWRCSIYTFLTTVAGLVALLLMVHSFLTRQLDVKGCEMSYMRPMYSRYEGFDDEHTRFATKYSLYLYNEGGVDNENFRVKGVPVLFIPGNAGSYKQVRSLASESAYLYHNVIRQDGRPGKLPLDFFSVDFNEDFTAFHGQTLLDQAEYLNDAIAYILSLYHMSGKFVRDSNLPDPASVIIVGHSMGGVVARTMLTMPGYQNNSINTIITLAAPHARAPASFDGDIVRTYRSVNHYWRSAYLQKNNPLEHMTLVSIAGGGLDTVVSSDYASIQSIVPESHGFTVFTSSMPNVWTGMDHLAITWCDQNRKSIVRALYDAIDATQASQTVSRLDRMSHFKRQFLTGLEDIVAKTLPNDSTTLLALDRSSALVADARLDLRSLGKSHQNPKAYLMPVPVDSVQQKQFTLLTNEKLDYPGQQGMLEVLFCSVLPPQPGQSATQFSAILDLTDNDPDATRLACKSPAAHAVMLPASTHQSTYPFKREQEPFSHLQYDLHELIEFQYIAIIDKAGRPSPGWLLAEFSTVTDSKIQVTMSLPQLLAAGISVELPANRPVDVTIHVAALQSSLFAFRLQVNRQNSGHSERFTPLVRQYITDVHESKFHVNVKDVGINLHGVSPYLPPALHAKEPKIGLFLQVWSDPTNGQTLNVTLSVDIMGSIGKLWMRYRIVFAAFPLLIVAIVLREQFRIYDDTGVFMSFSNGLNQCIGSILPMTFLTLMCLSITLAVSRTRALQARLADDDSAQILDQATYDLLLGSEDPFFWFLVPLFGIMCIGICVVINYVALTLEMVFVFARSMTVPSSSQSGDARRTPATFAVNSVGKRVLTTCVLLSMVSTIIPYQFAYVVLCIVQLATSIRACRLARVSNLNADYNFYNYSHSVLILMLWILPINLPVLVVWIRNLAIRWLTPFSSHHNILSIIPFLLLVETLSTGRMIPRAAPWCSLFTNVLLFGIGAYAAVYGVSYAYVLHHLANALCAWLVLLHFDPAVLSRERREAATMECMEEDMKKRP